MDRFPGSDGIHGGHPSCSDSGGSVGQWSFSGDPLDMWYVLMEGKNRTLVFWALSACCHVAGSAEQASVRPVVKGHV